MIAFDMPSLDGQIFRISMDLSSHTFPTYWNNYSGILSKAIEKFFSLKFEIRNGTKKTLKNSCLFSIVLMRFFVGQIG